MGYVALFMLERWASRDNQPLALVVAVGREFVVDRERESRFDIGGRGLAVGRVVVVVLAVVLDLVLVLRADGVDCYTWVETSYASPCTLPCRWSGLDAGSQGVSRPNMPRIRARDGVYRCIRAGN